MKSYTNGSPLFSGSYHPVSANRSLTTFPEMGSGLKTFINSFFGREGRPHSHSQPDERCFVFVVFFMKHPTTYDLSLGERDATLHLVDGTLGGQEVDGVG